MFKKITDFSLIWHLNISEAEIKQNKSKTWLLEIPFSRIKFLFLSIEYKGTSTISPSLNFLKMTNMYEQTADL